MKGNMTNIMKTSLLALAIAAGILLTGLPAAAHHSFAATYIGEKEVTVTGTVAQISLRSPHSFFFVESKDDKGAVQRWAFEGAAAGQLANQGVARETFKVGDPVTVIANPSRDPGAFRGRMVKITRTTDGKTWGGRPGEVVD
jgi:Family of unknown function (DUF6152)